VAGALIDAMWGSECLVLEAPLSVRVELLKAEYSHYISEPEMLAVQLECLAPLHGQHRIELWQDMARRGAWDSFVEELLVQHYDPAYTRAILKHYPALPRAARYTLRDASADDFGRIAAAIVENSEAHKV